jgi:hypothetical protein
MAPRKEASGPLEIAAIQATTTQFAILGKRPVILNRMSQKARFELLAPRGRKTTADKAMSLKHDPYEEFRASPYTLDEEDTETYLALMSSSFKGAMATAALDLPGSSKKQIGRLVWVEDDYTPLYGLPLLSMGVVRNSDPGHTPDIRSRAIVPEWACIIHVTYIETLIRRQAILNLLVAGGLTVGVGDFRPEKGKGTYGQFEVCNLDDPRFLAVCQQGRAAQKEAMEHPIPFDTETEELLAMWTAETRRRGFAIAG